MLIEDAECLLFLKSSAEGLYSRGMNEDDLLIMSTYPSSKRLPKPTPDANP